MKPSLIVLFLLILLQSTRAQIDDTLTRFTLVDSVLTRIQLLKTDSTSDTITIHYLQQSRQLLAILCKFDSLEERVTRIKFYPDDFPINFLEKADALIITNDSNILPFGKVLKFSLLKISRPNFYKKKIAYIQSITDSIKIPAFVKKPLGITYKSGWSINQNQVFSGAVQLPRHVFYQEISWSNKVFGLPLRLDFYQSNARSDAGATLSDLRLSFDLPAFKNELIAKEKLTNLKFNDLNEKLFEKEVEFKIQDSLRNELARIVLDPGVALDLNEQTKLLQKFNTLDTLDANQQAMRAASQQKLDKILAKQKSLDSLTQRVNETKASIEKIKGEQERISSKVEETYGETKSNFNRFTGWRRFLRTSVTALEIGKLMPFFSELSMNAATLTGLYTELNAGKWKFKLANGLLDNKFNPWLKNNQQLIQTQFAYSTPNSTYSLNLGHRYHQLNTFGAGAPLLTFSSTQTFSSVMLEFEWAYNFKDSNSNSISLYTNQKTVFQKSAGMLRIHWALTNNLSSETRGSFWGLGFVNPLISQPRRDLLRLEQKLKYSFPQVRATFQFYAKNETNNLSKLSILNSSFWHWQFSATKKIGKSWSLRGDYLLTKNLLLSSDPIPFSSQSLVTKMLSGTLSRNLFLPQKHILISTALQASSTTVIRAEDQTKAVQVSNSTTINFEKKGILISNVNTYLRANSDSSNSFQSNWQFLIINKYLTIGPGAGYVRKSHNSNWFFINSTLKFSIRSFNLVMTSFYDIVQNNGRRSRLFRNDLQLIYQF